MTTIADYIALNASGAPVIAGTRLHVQQLVEEKLSWGCSPEELHRNHPGISMAQIHAALAYYYDHQAEVDAQIARSDEEHRLARAAFLATPLGRRLAELKAKRLR